MIVINGCNHECTLPNFSKAALKTKAGKSDSGMSGEWTKLFDELCNTFEALAHEMNEELTSHCNGSGSDQVMAESPSLTGFAQTFRTGWTVCSIHSVFDHMTGSLVLTQQAGKAASKWTAKIGDSIIGGQPPTFDDIESDPDTLRRFTNVLFKDDANGHWSPKTRELLVMALLLRHDQFVDILQAHPFSTVVEDYDDQGSFARLCETIPSFAVLTRHWRKWTVVKSSLTGCLNPKKRSYPATYQDSQQKRFLCTAVQPLICLVKECSWTLVVSLITSTPLRRQPRPCTWSSSR